MSVQERVVSEQELPHASADELMARKFVHRIRKLRWMGMEDAARALEMELRNAPFASTLHAAPLYAGSPAVAPTGTVEAA